MSFSKLSILISAALCIGGCAKGPSTGSNEIYKKLQRHELSLPKPKLKPSFIKIKSLESIKKQKG